MRWANIYRIDGAKPSGVMELEVVGVVGDILENIVGRDEDGSRHLYLPFGKEYQANVTFHFKTAGGGPDAEKSNDGDDPARDSGG